MKKMPLNLSSKTIIDLLSNTKDLDSYAFYKKLDKAIKNIIGHKLFTLTVIDRSTKYVERVYSNNKKIYPLLGTKPIPKNDWTRKVIIEKKEFLASSFNEIKKLFFDYEIIYSGKINIKKQNVDLIVNISEDGWFGNSIGPYQHFNKAIYRAIEEGNYIARSTNNGISAFISPMGKILHKTKFNEVGTITASLPVYKNKTIFSIYGNKIFAIIIFLYILLIFYFKKVEKNEEKKLSFYK